MNHENNLKYFIALGKYLQHLSSIETDELFYKAANENPWFTKENVELALKGIIQLLNENDLTKWFNSYQLPQKKEKKIGVVMAGNIPAVGFHDLMCVLLSGNILLAKPSSQDSVLIKEIIKILIEIGPELKEKIFFVERLNDVDAIIATGSDNTSRYFEYYFKEKPHILRRNRTSVAILNGEETKEDIEELGKDIFQYFGLGCRNVSKIYIPEGYILDRFFEGIFKFEQVKNHHKYANNYDYNRSIYLMNQEKFLENGFVSLIESKNLVSPMAVIYYEFYKSVSDLQVELIENQYKIQCVVSNKAWFPQSIAFGNAQCPSVNDYADGIDTMEFLKNLESKL